MFFVIVLLKIGGVIKKEVVKCTLYVVSGSRCSSQM